VELGAKVQFALEEARMLVLGIQVLLGFNFQSFLLPRYDRLPSSGRDVMHVTLVMLLLAVVAILLPTAHHRVVEDGEDTRELEDVARWATSGAMLFFAGALGGAFYVIGVRLSSHLFGVVLAAVTTASALLAWYVVPVAVGRRHPAPREEPMQKTSLDDKIRHALTEARVVLPGTQAMLGFQLTGVFQSGFDDLATSSKVIHLVGFIFLGISVIVLMLPAAYHRIAEHGEDTEPLHRLTSVCIMLAMITLAGAIACDVHVVVHRAIGSNTWSVIGALVWLVVSLGAWLFAMLFIRARRHREELDGPCRA
jgi:Family of unknown function (DUF6328)